MGKCPHTPCKTFSIGVGCAAGMRNQFPGGSCPKVFRGLKGGFFQKPPCGGAKRLTRSFGCTRRMSGGGCSKVFRGLKGGFFQKAPSCASPLRAFLFDSFFFAPEHPVNQSPSAVRDSFSPRRRTAPLSYFICPRSRYLPGAKNSSPTVLRSFSLREKPNGFGLPGGLSKEKEELWTLMKQRKEYLYISAGHIECPPTEKQGA